MARTFGGATTDRVISGAADTSLTRTYSVWVRRTGTGGAGFGRIFSKSGSGTELEDFEYDAGSLNYYSPWNNGAEWSITAPSTDIWHHIAITYDATDTDNDPLIYVDGVSVLVTEILAPGGAWLNTGGAYILGNRGTTWTRNWAGDLAEFAIWNVVLTPTEVAALSNGALASTVQSTELAVYHRCLTAAAVEPDSSDHGLVGAATGTALTDPPVGATGGVLGRTFYISAAGSDLANGITASTPWETLTKVNATSFVPTSTIYFRSEDTFDGMIYNAYLADCELSSYDKDTGLPAAVGVRALLTNTTPDTVIGSPAADGVTISNLEIALSEAVTGEGQHSLIANDAATVCLNWSIVDCLMHQAGGSGIIINDVGSTGWSIHDNEISDVGDCGILVNAVSSGHEIYDNTIHDTGGFDALQGRHGIYARGVVSVHGNEFYGNLNGQGISLRAEGSEAYDNYIHDTASGIFCYDGVGAGIVTIYCNRFAEITNAAIYVDDVTFDTTIASNTILLNAAAEVGIDASAVLHASVELRNNIVLGGVNAVYGANASLDVGETVTEDYGCYHDQSSSTPFWWEGVRYSFADWQAVCGQAEHSITLDPELTSFTPALYSPVHATGTHFVTGLVYIGDAIVAPLHYPDSNPSIGASEALGGVSFIPLGALLGVGR